MLLSNLKGMLKRVLGAITIVFEAAGALHHFEAM